MFSLTVILGDVERQPDLRDQLMRDYGYLLTLFLHCLTQDLGVFVKTTKECDHLLGFSGTQMYNDDGAKLMNGMLTIRARARRNEL